MKDKIEEDNIVIFNSNPLWGGGYNVFIYNKAILLEAVQSGGKKRQYLIRETEFESYRAFVKKINSQMQDLKSSTRYGIPDETVTSFIFNDNNQIISIYIFEEELKSRHNSLYNDIEYLVKNIMQNKQFLVKGENHNAVVVNFLGYSANSKSEAFSKRVIQELHIENLTD